MKLRLLLISLLFSSVFNVLLAEPPSYIQTKDGVIVFTDPVFTGTSHAVKLEVVSDNIIRVSASPFKKNVSTKSLVVVHNKRSGSIIPFGPDLQYTSEKPADTITLNIYSGADALFNLYEDEGTNYNYEKGAFSVIPINYNEATKAITIGDRKGSFNGMLENRTFRINIITSGKTKRLDFNANCDKEISYQGKKLFIKI